MVGILSIIKLKLSRVIVLDFLEVLSILESFNGGVREVVNVKCSNPQNSISYFFSNPCTVENDDDVFDDVFRICFVVIDGVVYLYVSCLYGDYVKYFKFSLDGISYFDIY